MFAEEEESVSETCGVDLSFKFILETLLVWSRFPADHHREFGVFFKQGDGCADKEINALLLPDAAEDANTVLTGEAEFTPEGGAVFSGAVGVQVNTVGDDDIRAIFNIGCGGAAGADDGIRLADQVTGDPAVLPLGGGGEGDADFGAEAFLQDKRLDDLVVAPGVKDSVAAIGERFAAQLDQLAKGNVRDAIGR